MKDYTHIAVTYAHDVIADRISACKWAKLACRNFLADLKACDSDLYPYVYDQKKVNLVCGFCELLHHVKGKWASKKERFVMAAYQVFITAYIFGFLHRDSGYRRCREVFIFLPRKSGKTFFAAALSLYMMCADGEAAPEIYCAATGIKGAKEVWGAAKQMIKRNGALKRAFKLDPRASTILLPDGGKMEPVVRCPQEGQSPHFSVLDEVHQFADDTALQVFRTGGASRTQPLILSITTAGYSLASPAYELFEHSKKVLEGTLEQPEFLSFVYTIDKDDDPYSDAALIKANPGYGVSADHKFLRTQRDNAMRRASEVTPFLTRHLNVWCGAAQSYYSVRKWQDLADPALTPDRFIGLPCWIGLDLSKTTDLTSYCILFRDGDHYYSFFRTYATELLIDDPRNSHYQKWHREEILEKCPGQIISYKQVAADLMADAAKYGASEICVDPYRIEFIREYLTDYTGQLVEIRQNFGGLHHATTTLEGLILTGNIHHTGDALTAWAVGNVAVGSDKMGNVKPERPKFGTPEKIDPVMALLDALARAAVSGGNANSGASTWFEPFSV